MTESCGKERKAKTEEKGESPYSFGFSPIPGWYKKSLNLTFSFSLAIFSLYIFLRSFCEHFNFCFCLMGICHSSVIYIKCHFDFLLEEKKWNFLSSSRKKCDLWLYSWVAVVEVLYFARWPLAKILSFNLCELCNLKVFDSSFSALMCFHLLSLICS